MSNATSTSKYEMCLVGKGNGEVYSDMMYTTFMRFPIVKNSGFVITRINMPTVHVQKIMYDIGKNVHTPFDLQLFHIDDNNKKVKILFDKPYAVLTAKTFNEIDLKSEHTHVQLVLVNPILHSMNSVNAYNKILNNKNTINVVDDFESFLKANYGDCFHSNHIGKNIKQNSHVYEQILTYAKSDAHIPEYLINSYKPFHSFSFYFFDDFYNSTNCKKDIACHFINLYDPNQFEKFDVSEFEDIVSNTKFKGKADFADHFAKVLKNDEVVSFVTNEMKQTANQISSSKIPQIKGGTNLQYELLDERKSEININSQYQSKTIGQAIQNFNLSVPDTAENALERIKTLKDMVSNRIERIEYYEVKNCMHDWLQFGRLYNLDADSGSKYIYTPLGITNIFSRISQKEVYLRHTAKCSMIKYNDKI